MIQRKLCNTLGLALESLEVERKNGIAEKVESMDTSQVIRTKDRKIAKDLQTN